MPNNDGTCLPYTVLTFSIGCGTGRSEIAASLAYLLATRGYRVWLVDGNLFAPSLDLLLGFRDGTDTLCQYLAGSQAMVPAYDIPVPVENGESGGLLLTPASRDETVRRQVEEVLQDSDWLAERLPEGIMQRAAMSTVDVIVVDSVPDLTPINRVWLAMSSLLLVVSGPNSVDSELLQTVFREDGVRDVTRKLVLFNNLELDDAHTPRGAMAPGLYEKRVADLIRSHTTGMIFGQDVEVFPAPVPFSSSLATFDHRDGLFVQHHPSSSFSRRMIRLSELVEVGLRDPSPHSVEEGKTG